MEIIYNLFCFPAGWLAAFFFGVKPLWSDGELYIPLSSPSIHVTASCSAVGFFVLLYFYTLFFISHRVRLKIFPLLALGVLPCVFCVTILANAFRIISAYEVYQISRQFLPASFQGPFHLGVGIAVFMGVLILTSVWLERTWPQ